MCEWHECYTRKIQPAYANQRMALSRRLYLDAKINSSTRRAEAAADRRHAKLAKKREEFLREDLRVRWRWCGYRHSPVTSIRYFIRKNSPHLLSHRNYFVERARLVVYNLCRGPDSGQRFPFLRPSGIFARRLRICMSLAPQTSRCVKWYLHKLRFIRRAECNVETSARSQTLGTLNGAARCTSRAQHSCSRNMTTFFIFYWNSFNMHARCVARKTQATGRRLSVFFRPIRRAPSNKIIKNNKTLELHEARSISVAI